MGEQVAAGFIPKQVLKRETAERFIIILVFTSDQKVKQKRFLLSDD